MLVNKCPSQLVIKKESQKDKPKIDSKRTKQFKNEQNNLKNKKNNLKNRKKKLKE